MSIYWLLNLALSVQSTRLFPHESSFIWSYTLRCWACQLIGVWRSVVARSITYLTCCVGIDITDVYSRDTYHTSYYAAQTIMISLLLLTGRAIAPVSLQHAFLTRRIVIIIVFSMQVLFIYHDVVKLLVSTTRHLLKNTHLTRLLQLTS